MFYALRRPVRVNLDEKNRLANLSFYPASLLSTLSVILLIALYGLSSD